ncbi:hypothetical protein WR25_20627 isoform E [Diploscapter pachys]|uniref:Uncharacterized protein n=2 Tax=Diploscapter pachys TaxID=2018661 RepID=A0A2A2KZY1_9BILA|nr:hypothetical protein WR25_20627 isoform A [Diploscapter pachys]PAV79397.1 hypothetical protein WR25_20627 isoform E [Diploscapter pachys]
MSRSLSNVRMVVGDVSGESEGSEDSGKQPVIRTSRRIPKPKQHYSAEDYMNEAEMDASIGRKRRGSWSGGEPAKIEDPTEAKPAVGGNRQYETKTVADEIGKPEKSGDQNQETSQKRGSRPFDDEEDEDVLGSQKIAQMRPPPPLKKSKPNPTSLIYEMHGPMTVTRKVESFRTRPRSVDSPRTENLGSPTRTVKSNSKEFNGQSETPKLVRYDEEEASRLGGVNTNKTSGLTNKNKKQVRFAEGAPEIITDTLKSGSKKPVTIPASILHKLELPKAGHIKLDKLVPAFLENTKMSTRSKANLARSSKTLAHTTPEFVPTRKIRKINVPPAAAEFAQRLQQAQERLRQSTPQMHNVASSPEQSTENGSGSGSENGQTQVNVEPVQRPNGWEAQLRQFALSISGTPSSDRVTLPAPVAVNPSQFMLPFMIPFVPQDPMMAMNFARMSGMGLAPMGQIRSLVSLPLMQTNENQVPDLSMVNENSEKKPTPATKQSENTMQPSAPTPISASSAPTPIHPPAAYLQTNRPFAVPSSPMASFYPLVRILKKEIFLNLIKISKFLLILEYDFKIIRLVLFPSRK